jgi:O-methyltransferase domain
VPTILLRAGASSGDALSMHWGNGYDAVLLANFLQLHGDADAATLLTKARTALAPGGAAYIVEALPDEDRTQGEGTVQGVTLLALTPAGGTRTYSELSELCRAAGFADTELVPLPATAQALVVAYVDASSKAGIAGTSSSEIAARAEQLQQGQEDTLKANADAAVASKSARGTATSPEEMAWNYPMNLSGQFTQCITHDYKLLQST